MLPVPTFMTHPHQDGYVLRPSKGDALRPSKGGGQVTTTTSLSDFWRCDRCDDLVRELVSVLQGADILIGNMGSDIRVVWSGQETSFTDFEQRTVALDYGPLQDQACPLPGDRVDEVVGYAAHEGGHCLWTSSGAEATIRHHVATRWDALPDALQQDWQHDHKAVLAELCRIHNVLEDAYVDRCVASAWPVLGQYIAIARNRLLQRTDVDLAAIAAAPHPDRNAAVNLWLGVSLYGQALPGTMSPAVRRAMDKLLDLTRQTTNEEHGPERQRMALDAAAILWQAFSAKARSLDVRPPGAPAVTEEAGNLDDFDPATGPNACGRRVVPVPEGILERVAEATVGDVEVLSAPVARVLAEDPRQVATRAVQARYDPEKAGEVMSLVWRQVSEIKQAFRHLKVQHTRWRRGLDRGSLDDRRLWKPPIGDPGYLKRKEVAGKPSLAVALLLDVSGSMGSYAPIVEQTAAVFFQGLIDMPGTNFAAWCYTGQSARVSLTCICGRQHPRLCLAGVTRGGNTPSGAAIAGVKVLLERMPEKQKILFHFTDGRPDSSAHVHKAVAACWQAGIRVQAIGLLKHCDMLCQQYGEDNYETIETVTELPRAVARMVKRLGAPTQRAGIARPKLGAAYQIRGDIHDRPERQYQALHR